MWVTATKDELRDFLRDRLTPTFETCRPVKERMAEPTLTGFAFDGMPYSQQPLPAEVQTVFQLRRHRGSYLLLP